MGAWSLRSPCRVVRAGPAEESRPAGSAGGGTARSGAQKACRGGLLALSADRYPGTSALGLPGALSQPETAGSPPTRQRKIGLVRTFSPKVNEIQRAWYVVDADGLVLGRLASEVAAVLRGKRRPYFAPHVDTGDNVIVVNAERIVLTSNKAEAKMAYRHSGYPGGLRSTSYATLLDEEPAELIRRSVRGMLPKNTLGRQQLSKLHVYAGAEHPHAAQKPEPLEIPEAQSRRRAG